jgi:hypothetical protein
MVKWKLNQEEWSGVYLTILESLAVNYTEVRGQMNSTWSNSPANSIKTGKRNEDELNRDETVGADDRHQ